MADEETPAADQERLHEDATAGDAGADSRQVLTWIGAVVAPLTLLTALAYYFGWRRERAFAGYFGIDPSVLGLSSNDYVLRSVGPLFAPVACVLLVGFVFVCARLLVSGRTPPRWLAPSALIVGLAALTVGVLLAAGHGIASNFIYLQAFAPALGVVLIAYALSRTAGAANPRHRGALRGLHYLTISVVLVSLFWATAEYADSRGTKEAETLAKNLTVDPSVTIFSKQNLNIKPADYGPDPRCPLVFASRNPRSDYPYSYSGFTLLLRNAGDWYLTPTPQGQGSPWTPLGEPVLIIPDNDAVRIELDRGLGYPVKPLEGTIAVSAPAFTC